MGTCSHQLETQFCHQQWGRGVGEHAGELSLVAHLAPGFVIQPIEPFGVCTHPGDQESASMHAQIGWGRVPVFLSEASTFSRSATAAPASVSCVLCAHVPSWISVRTRWASSSEPGSGGVPFLGPNFSLLVQCMGTSLRHSLETLQLVISSSNITCQDLIQFMCQGVAPLESGYVSGAC